MLSHLLPYPYVCIPRGHLAWWLRFELGLHRRIRAIKLEDLKHLLIDSLISHSLVFLCGLTPAQFDRLDETVTVDPRILKLHELDRLLIEVHGPLVVGKHDAIGEMFQYRCHS